MAASSQSILVTNYNNITTNFSSLQQLTSFLTVNTTQLKHLKIAGFNLDINAAKTLSAVLKKYNTFTDIEISWCNLTDSGLNVLLNSFKTSGNTIIDNLNLQYNNLTDIAVNYLVKFISGKDRLRNINLQYNNINDSGVTIFLNYANNKIVNRKSHGNMLNSIDFRNNPLNNLSGVTNIAQVTFYLSEQNTARKRLGR